MMLEKLVLHCKYSEAYIDIACSSLKYNYVSTTYNYNFHMSSSAPH